MKVSVALITYNHEKHIRQSLDSVFAQHTDFEWEVVVGDDRSTDGTTDIIREYVEKYGHRVRVLPRERNLGMAGNVLDILQNCRGEYIALLEGDDYWSSDEKLKRQVERLDSRPDAALCFHPVTYVYEDGRAPATFPFPLPPERTTIADLLTGNYIQTCSVMLRRASLPNPLPEFLWTLKLLDWPICVLSARHGYIDMVPENMANYRVHSGGLWSMKPTDQVMQSMIRMFQALDAHLNYEFHAVVKRSVLRAYDRVIEYRREKLKSAELAAMKYMKSHGGMRTVLSKGGVRILAGIYASGVLSMARRLRGLPRTVLPDE